MLVLMKGLISVLLEVLKCVIKSMGFNNLYEVTLLCLYFCYLVYSSCFVSHDFLFETSEIVECFKETYGVGNSLLNVWSCFSICITSFLNGVYMFFILYTVFYFITYYLYFMWFFLNLLSKDLNSFYSLSWGVMTFFYNFNFYCFLIIVLFMVFFLINYYSSSHSFSLYCNVVKGDLSTYLKISMSGYELKNPMLLYSFILNVFLFLSYSFSIFAIACLFIICSYYLLFTCYYMFNGGDGSIMFFSFTSWLIKLCFLYVDIFSYVSEVSYFFSNLVMSNNYFSYFYMRLGDVVVGFKLFINTSLFTNYFFFEGYSDSLCYKGVTLGSILWGVFKILLVVIVKSKRLEWGMLFQLVLILTIESFLGDSVLPMFGVTIAFYLFFPVELSYKLDLFYYFMENLNFKLVSVGFICLCSKFYYMIFTENFKGLGVLISYFMLDVDLGGYLKMFLLGSLLGLLGGCFGMFFSYIYLLLEKTFVWYSLLYYFLWKGLLFLFICESMSLMSMMLSFLDLWYYVWGVCSYFCCVFVGYGGCEIMVFMIMSTDVIHSFFCCELCVKLDAIPGYINYFFTDFYFIVNWEVFSIVCTEYCGVFHSYMVSCINFLDLFLCTLL